MNNIKNQLAQIIGNQTDSKSIQDSINIIKETMKHSETCGETLAMIMDEALDRIKNISLGIDYDSNGHAIIHTMVNEDFQEIMKSLRIFGDEYLEYNCWDTVEKHVQSYGGDVEVTAWYTKFPLKLYESVIYKVLKDKLGLVRPVWENTDPQLKETLEELDRGAYVVGNSHFGASFFFHWDKILDWVKKNCPEDVSRYKSADDLPYYFLTHTINEMIRKFGYFKYKVTNFYWTTFGDYKIGVVETNFPFNYICNEMEVKDCK